MDYRNSSFHIHGTSPSSSTLSPHAPPFTVHSSRSIPHDRIPRPPPTHANPYVTTSSSASLNWPPVGSAAPIRPSLASNLVQAEPFYPQYGVGAVSGDGVDASVCYDVSCGISGSGRVDARWHELFDGGSNWEKGIGAGIISSWMEPKDNCVGESLAVTVVPKEIDNIVCSSWTGTSSSGFTSGHAAAVEQGAVTFEGFSPYENISCGHLAEHFAGKKARFESDCRERLDDKPSCMHVHAQSMVPVKQSAASALSPSATNVPFLSYPYDSIVAKPGSCQSKQIGYCKKTTHSSPTLTCSSCTIRNNASVDTSMQKNPSLSLPSVDGFNSYAYHRAFSSSKLPHSSSSKVEIKPCPVDRSKKHNGMNKTQNSIGLPENESSDKENSVLSLKPDSECQQDSSTTKTDLEVPNLNVCVNADTCVSNQNSSEVSDQLDLAVDSPCWKGASASRYSPSHVNNDQFFRSYSRDQSLDDSDKKGSDDSAVTENDMYKCSNSLEKKNEIPLLSGGLKSESPSKDSEIISGSKDCINSITKPLSQNYAATAADSNPITKSCDRDVHSIPLSKPSVPSSEGFCYSKKVVEACEASSCADVHFLVSSLHDLSKFLSGYCYDSNVLKKDDYELLLMTISNLDECVSSTAIKADYQNVSHEAEVSGPDMSDFRRRSNSKHTHDLPDRPHSVKSSVDSHKFHACHMDIKKNISISKELDKSTEKASRSYTRQNILSEKHPDSISACITRKLEDVDASVMSRARILKDRDVGQHKLQDSVVVGTSLNANNFLGQSSNCDLNDGMQLSTALAASTFASEHCLCYSHESEDGNGKQSEPDQEYWASYDGTENCDGQFFDASTTIPEGPAGLQGMHVNTRNKPILQPPTYNDQPMEGYCVARHNSTTSDWEHVQREDLKW